MFLTSATECASLEQFLDFWSEKYRDPRDSDLYDPYVGKPMTAESRQRLFEWKNGMPLSKLKSISVENYYPLSVEVTALEQRYLDPSGDGGPIWNIFYMHCVAPHRWPIFDQHSYRAMHFLKTGGIKEIPSRKADKYAAYKEEYIPFVRSLNAKQRKIDKALYSFGQLLKPKAHRRCP